MCAFSLVQPSTMAVSAGKAITLQFQKLSMQKDELEKKLMRQAQRIQEYEKTAATLSEEINSLKVAKRLSGGCQVDKEITKKTAKEVKICSNPSKRVGGVGGRTNGRSLADCWNACVLKRASPG